MPDAGFVQAQPIDRFAPATRQGLRWTVTGAEVVWTEATVFLTATAPVSRVALR